MTDQQSRKRWAYPKKRHEVKKRDAKNQNGYYDRRQQEGLEGGPSRKRKPVDHKAAENQRASEIADTESAISAGPHRRHAFLTMPGAEIPRWGYPSAANA